MRLPTLAHCCVVAFSAVWAPDAPFASPIYRCVIEGAVTYSDRPCADHAEPYAPAGDWVSTVEVATSPDSKTRAAPARKARRMGSGSIAAAQAKHKEECSRLQDSLREIRSQLRAGYDAKRGERLKERERKLNADLRSKRC